MGNIDIRRATEADAQVLSDLSSITFNYFRNMHNNKDKDVDLYISTHFSKEKQFQELINKQKIIFIAYSDDKAVGYAMLTKGTTEQCLLHANSIELQRLYVLQSFHRQGIASQLMHTCLNECNEYDSIWLGVWEHNTTAIRFYETFKFKNVGTHIFQFGSDPQIDLIYELVLNK